MKVTGRSLELFFIDGRPDGMLTAEVFNWTGHVLRIPRIQIKEGLALAETRNTGVYVLMGERDGTPLAYIGEAENMHERIKQHATSKDWWDDAILVSTTGDMLHKAHAKYLESRLVEIARNVGAIALENASTPPRSSLTEAGIANMEGFLDTLGMVFPAIRVDMFLEKSRDLSVPTQQVKAVQSGVGFELKTPKNGISALATLVSGELIVKAGSKARAPWKGATVANAQYFRVLNELIHSGVLRKDADNSVFVTDYAFSSPSAAASVINGRSSNGRREWKHSASGQSFGDWEAQQLESEEPPE